MRFSDLEAVVTSLEVKPGWHLRLVELPEGAKQRTGSQSRLEIYTDPIPNTRRMHRGQGETTQLFMPREAPPGAEDDADTFRRWVIYEYLWLQLHEALEWVRDVETGHPVIDPHNSDATVTGLLPPRPGEEWWRQ